MAQTSPSKSFSSRLFAPVDVASLVYFRIVFGAILLWDLILFDQQRIVYHWIAPKFHFTYFGFDWVHPLPDDGMFAVVYALRVLAVMIAAGLFYRVSCTIFFVGFTYLFLIDQAEHLNHVYLTCLLSFLMIFIPAHRAFSVDALLRPGRRSDTAPGWCLYLLQFQIAVVYIFGALAKVNGDWLRGEPVRSWLAGRADYPVIGPLFGHEVVVYVIAYGGLLFDLLVVPLLLNRRTRVPAFAVSVFFHLMNNWLFDIAIFPWLMLAATLLYFPPDWPRKFLGFPSPSLRSVEGGRHPLALTLLTLYALIQVLIPLRHWAYPGDVNWTEEGHRFSWHMKLRSKAGQAVFTATDPATGRTWPMRTTNYLTPWQAGRMSTRPDMVLQFGHHLAAALRDEEGVTNAEIRARVLVSLNGRKPQLLVDPNANLAAQPRSLRHATWILPLTEPLPPREELIARAAARREGKIMSPERQIEEINRILVNEFRVDPRGLYQFDEKNLILYSLIRKPGTDGTNVPTTAAEIESQFERREHSRLPDQAAGDRFLTLQAAKTKANRAISAMKAAEGAEDGVMSPADLE